MSRQIQIRRGTSAQNDNFTGAIGEVTMDTTNKTIRVHDGSTTGGNKILSENKFYSYTTNCVTEMAKNIKLELTNGTLTLKSGSKVYIPNGSGVFEQYTIPSDMSISAPGNGTRTLFIRKDNKQFAAFLETSCVSGTSDSLSGNAYHIWYDTTNNVIQGYTSDADNPAYSVSLPLCVVTCTSNEVSSIDQVFNGFGYIGSTVYVLPSNKFLIPNGYNNDGTLRNLTVTTTSIKNLTVNGNTSIYVAIDNAGSIAWWSVSNTVYNKKENLNYYNGNRQYRAVVGKYDVVNNKISNFELYDALHILDYNDTEFISSQSMPSSKYTNLTLGASGTTYTMPENGWFNFVKNSTAAGQYIKLVGQLTDVCTAVSSGDELCCCIPVSKGESMKVLYDANGTTQTFKFIYANGSK